MKKVLIVDDDKQIPFLIKAYLEADMGFSCEIVSNGMDALEKILIGGYFLVISDFQMPGTFDGIDVVTACLDRKIPFIIMSGERESFIKEASQRLGRESLEKVMARFMGKPFSLNLLNEAVKNVMESRIAA